MKLSIVEGKVGRRVETLAGSRWVALNTDDSALFGLEEELIRDQEEATRAASECFGFRMRYGAPTTS